MWRSSRVQRASSSSTSDLAGWTRRGPERGRAGSICTSIIERDPALLVAITSRLPTGATDRHSQASGSSGSREGGWLRWTYRRFTAESSEMEPADLVRRKARSRHMARIHREKTSDIKVFDSFTNRDWSDAQRLSVEPHRLSLEGLNLEVVEHLEADMTSQPATSRQQLLEEVLQTKELLQKKQRHKNSGGWTMTTAEVLNTADREELQVQMEAYRQKVQLRQRKMSAALKAQPPVTKTLSDASCELSHGERNELEQRLQSLESHIRQSELCARDTVTQIRSRRRQQLRAIQDLGVVDANLAMAGAPSAMLSPATTPTGVGESGSAGDWEEAGTLRRPRSLHSPSLTRRRTPLRFISNLGRKQRRSGSEWEEPQPERSPEATSPLRSQISPGALQEISRFEKMMENFLQQRQTVAPLRCIGLPTAQQCL